jgi:hypothetical protein
VSEIGDGFGVPECGSADAPRPVERTDPVTEASGMAPSAVARDQPGEHVVAECEIGGGRSRPHAEQRDGANADPEHDRPEADLLACVSEGVAGLRPRGLLRCRTARGSPAVILRLVLGMMTGTMRHRHSRAGRTRFRTAQMAEPI